MKKNITWTKNDDGIVIISIWHNNWLEKILHRFIKFPERLDMDFDELGSFVWENIDGKKNIFELVNLTQERFGTKTEPVYKKTLIFFKQLIDNKLINLIKQDKDKIKSLDLKKLVTKVINIIFFKRPKKML